MKIRFRLRVEGNTHLKTSLPSESTSKLGDLMVITERYHPNWIRIPTLTEVLICQVFFQPGKQLPQLCSGLEAWNLANLCPP